MSNIKKIGKGSVVLHTGIKNRYMTVQELRKGGKVMCVWFEDNKGFPLHGLFNITNLKLIEG